MSGPFACRGAEAGAGDAATLDPAAGALLHDTVAQRIASGEVNLPLPPRVATEVLALTRDDASDVSRLAQLLHQDPALASHVLRIANSPAFLARAPIVSLQQAITRLGLKMLAEVALVASVQSGVFQVRGHEAELRQIWRHALASAAFGREIARALRTNVESAFVCGLLHTIGKPLVLQTTVDVAGVLGVLPRQHEMAALIDELHVRAGELLAERWALPRAVRQSIAAYATYDPADECGHEPVITALADHLASWLLAEGDDPEAARCHRAFADLNLYPEDADALLAKRDAVVRLVDTMVL